MLRQLVIASLCAFAANSAALADLRLCNKSAKSISFALGIYVDGQWVTNGYWATEPGKCALVVEGDLEQRYYYTFGLRSDGSKWRAEPDQRGAKFCVGPGRMNNVTDDACVPMGGELERFLLLDTQGAKSYIRNFSAPGEVAGDQRIYEATCFNIRTSGGFVSKTLQELVASDEAEAIGIAVCTYYSGQAPACLKTAKEGTKIVNQLTRAGGSDYWGTIHARPGYEICRAFWDTSDWSVTGATTFNTTIVRTADENGLGYYVSMPVGRNRGDWIDTKVILEQVPAGTRGSYNCWATGSNPWICKGAGCSSEMPGARVSLPPTTGQGICIAHGR